LAIVVEWRQARHATSLDEWHATLFPPSDDHEHAALWRRIGQRQSDEPDPAVTSFFDVLTFGSVPQRQAVIALVSQQFTPEFAPVLRAALRDEHNVVRVQAATAIARLEQQLFERTLALEAAVARAPEDADAILALASHHDNQAFTGILDPSREAASRVKAAQGYTTRLQLRPDDQSTEFRLARLLLRRGLAADAEPGFRRLAAARYPGATLWLMECLFAQGRYEQVREVASAADADEIRRLTPDVQTMLDLWTGIGDAA
jgi:polysaccharide biosynthesis protein PelE